MNTLSWLIILIGIFEKLSGYMTFISVISGSIFILSIFATFFTYMTLNGIPHRIDLNLETKWLPWIKTATKYAATAFIVSAFIGVFAIKKDYLVLIAASEIGEMVIETEAAQKVGGEISAMSGEASELLRTYIQVQTKDLKKKLLPPQQSNP